jgi:hypothetical protein
VTVAFGFLSEHQSLILSALYSDARAVVTDLQVGPGTQGSPMNGGGH